MRIHLVILVSMFLGPLATAGGSLGWADACQRLERDCPKLLAVINQCFEVSPVGGALRLGPRSIDVIEGRAGVGDRVPPYEFDCKPKGTAGAYSLTIEISDFDDGWKFIIRDKQMKKPAEVGADHPTIAPESNPVGKDKPRPE